MLMQNLTHSILLQTLDKVYEGIYLLNSDGYICYWNRACEIITGVKASSILNKSCEELNDKLHTKYILNDFKDGIAGPMGQDVIPLPEEKVIRSLDGRLVPIIARQLSLVDHNTRAFFLGEILEDISSLRQAQRKQRGLEKQIERVGDQRKVHKMIGKHPLMEQVYEQIRQAATTDAAVLVLGQSGTGKELVADAIHHFSKRKDKPFIKINCSAIPEALLESELFGHVKGSFTGAYQDKVGRFEAAEGGTVFLDEIGDLAPPIQVKLLRFLQEKTFERVGESITRHADVRIVSATNVNLTTAVIHKKFREDLYYRLRVFPIKLPSLSARRDDIPLLVHHFLVEFSRKMQKDITSISTEAMAILTQHSWPGNIRELENAIEYAFVICNGTTIEEEHLPHELRMGMSDINERFSNTFDDTYEGSLCDVAVDVSKSDVQSLWQVAQQLKNPETDKKILIDTLEKTRWNRTKAAEALGLSRMTIWKKMKKYDLL